jgi:hypothetical protein
MIPPKVSLRVKTSLSPRTTRDYESSERRRRLHFMIEDQFTNEFVI